MQGSIITIVRFNHSIVFLFDVFANEKRVSMAASVELDSLP